MASLREDGPIFNRDKICSTGHNRVSTLLGRNLTRAVKGPPTMTMTFDPDGLIDDLLSFAEKTCSSAYQDFQERLETESVEYGISEETLTEIFVKSDQEERGKMPQWFVVSNLAVASIYFLGRYDRSLVRQALSRLRQSIVTRFGETLGEDAGYPLESMRRVLKEGGFDAYQAGVLTFLTHIGYLDHADSMAATLDPSFLTKFRLDFAKTIPYLHQEATPSESCSSPA
jgi:hypothetical protein